MTTNTINTLELLCFAIGNVGLIALYARFFPTLSQSLDRIAEKLEELAATEHQDSTLTRRRIGQVKTRLADDEKDDQADKARERTRKDDRNTRDRARYEAGKGRRV